MRANVIGDCIARAPGMVTYVGMPARGRNVRRDYFNRSLRRIILDAWRNQ